MRLERQLQRWQAAGIIDAVTAERIVAHEGQTRRPLLLAAIAGLGACTIGVGLISVIAANWGDIPRFAKLFAMLVLLGANAYGLAQAPGHRQRWLTDALAIGYFVLTIASIALVGQTYQLAGKPYQALLLWLLAGSPALWLAQGGWAALLFLGALVITGAAACEPLVDLLGGHSQVAVLVRASMLSAAVFGPLLLASLPLLQRLRPAFAAVYAWLGWGVLVLAASVSVHVWYLSINASDVRKAWVIALVVGVFVALSLWRLQGLAAHSRAAWLLPARVLIGFATTITGLGVLLPHTRLALFGALGFVLIWALVAWCGYQAHVMSIINLATAVIAARLFMVYIEVFGSLLATGVGLIGSGVLLLALTWVWVRKIRLQPGSAL